MISKLKNQKVINTITVKNNKIRQYYHGKEYLELENKEGLKEGTYDLTYLKKGIEVIVDPQLEYNYDIPELLQEFTINSDLLLKVLEFSCKDETRSGLYGVIFDGNEIAASDGITLIWEQIEANIDVPFILARDVLSNIPKKTVLNIKNYNDFVVIEFNFYGSKASLFTLKYKPVDYKAVIPEDYTNYLNLQITKEQLQTLKVVNKVVIIEPNKVSSVDVDKGITKEIKLQCSLSEPRVCFENDFLQRIIKVSGEELALKGYKHTYKGTNFLIASIQIV